MRTRIGDDSKTGGEWWQGLGRRCDEDKDWSEDEDWSKDDSDHTAWCVRLGGRERGLGSRVRTGVASEDY